MPTKTRSVSNVSHKPAESKGLMLDQRIIAVFIAGLVLGGIIGSLYQKVKIAENGIPVQKSADAKVENTQDTAGQEEQKAELVINDSDPFMGKKDAKVTLAIFSDFLCPFCAAISGESKNMTDSMKQRDSTWEPAMPGIIRDYVNNGKVKLVWKDLPFHGDPAIEAHAASRCANDQGKFWEYHNQLFAVHDKEGEDNFSVTNLKKYAESIKLNMNDFNSCVDSGKYKKLIQDALAYGQKVGVNGTPATYINGKLISGAASYSTFKDAIEEALKKS
jgi:protein-disulfide isomerase